ncbi:MAG: HlyC/CorC family transporter [Deltaproteobacteria bacterium]|nr:MAG: HlyC/CorC family transporter [Deltaproteobacteria bacterium]
MTDWMYDITKILIALFLVLVNGFFVASEFALVKLRRGRLEELVKTRRPFAVTARWLSQRLDASLSACQLGITMASLGLGWIGEPAVAHLLRPLLIAIGVNSEIILHTAAFIIAFTAITAAHLVLGEQAPKIAAIRNPENAALWSAVPLKLFYYLSYPLLASLNAATSFLLRTAGIAESSGHDMPHSEEEIRTLVRQAHIHGELSRSEHRLISAVFDFDELICRRVMVPRIDVVFLDVNSSLSDIMAVAKRAKHSRYPVCEGSIDNVVGVAHIKDLVVMPSEEGFELRSIMRSPQFVPETLPIRRLLGQFQSTHQHLAFVVDEHGTVMGIVTLENVLEPIVGSVEDEFDNETPEIAKVGDLKYMVAGSTPIEIINRQLGLNLFAEGIDTISGLLMEKADKLLAVGDRIALPGAEAEVLEVKGRRTTQIRFILSKPPPEEF